MSEQNLDGGQNVPPAEPNGGEGSGEGASVDYNSLEHFHSLAKQYDMRVFTPKGLEDHTSDIRKNAFPEFAGPIDKVVENLTGIKKADDMKTKDYVKMAFSELSSKAPNAEEITNSIKAQLESEYQDQFQQFASQNEELKTALEQEKQNFETYKVEKKAADDRKMLFGKLEKADLNTGNDALEMSAKKDATEAFFKEFEIKDHEGQPAIWRKPKHEGDTGSWVYDSQGVNRYPKPVEEFLNEYVEAFTEKYSVTGAAAKPLTKEQVVQAGTDKKEQQWREAVKASGEYPHTAKAIKMRQEAGLPLTDIQKKVLGQALR